MGLAIRTYISDQEDDAVCAEEGVAWVQSREEVQRIVQQIRSQWPKVWIILWADSGFCREELMACCETHRWYAW